RTHLSKHLRNSGDAPRVSFFRVVIPSSLCVTVKILIEEVVVLGFSLQLWSDKLGAQLDESLAILRLMLKIYSFCVCLLLESTPLRFFEKNPFQRFSVPSS
ncbi:unnamed protein product, partial [Phaeothamnion confervicola]